LKDFVVVVLFTFSVFLVAMTPLVFFLALAFEAMGSAGLYYVWLTLVPAVAIILIWTFIIRRLRSASRKGRAN